MKKLLILWLITFSSVLFAQHNTTELINEAETRCNNKNAEICYLLAIKYDFGDKYVRQDKFKSVELYQIACNGNYEDGCVNLGNMYYFGVGVRQDKSKALSLYGKACDLKSQLGCENYAKLKNRGVN